MGEIPARAPPPRNPARSSSQRRTARARGPGVPAPAAAGGGGGGVLWVWRSSARARAPFLGSSGRERGVGGGRREPVAACQDVRREPEYNPSRARYKFPVGRADAETRLQGLGGAVRAAAAPRFRRSRRGRRLRLDHGQRPLPALAAHGGHAPFSFAWLGALGERTSRAIIGTSVVTPTFRYHPAIVAQAIGTLGSLYPGRVLLGVGTGEALNEVPATGMPWPPFKERLGRLREAIELMRRLAREERVTFEGSTIGPSAPPSTTAPRCRCRSTSQPPGPTAARLAGRLGDGFICTSGKARGALHRDLTAGGRRGPRAGRPRSGQHRAHDRDEGVVRHDQERALQDTRHWAALALSAEEKTGVEDPVEMERLADALPIERAASRWIVSSDPDEHVERLGRDHRPRLHPPRVPRPGSRPAPFLDLYAEQVLPPPARPLRRRRLSRFEGADAPADTALG